MVESWVAFPKILQEEFKSRVLGARATPTQKYPPRTKRLALSREEPIRLHNESSALISFLKFRRALSPHTGALKDRYPAQEDPHSRDEQVSSQEDVLAESSERQGMAAT